jgi:hypothetical protein
VRDRSGRAIAEAQIVVKNSETARLIIIANAGSCLTIIPHLHPNGWAKGPLLTQNPVDEFYKKGCQKEKLRLDRSRDLFLEIQPTLHMPR